MWPFLCTGTPFREISSEIRNSVFKSVLPRQEAMVVTLFLASRELERVRILNLI